MAHSQCRWRGLKSRAVDGPKRTSSLNSSGRPSNSSATARRTRGSRDSTLGWLERSAWCWAHFHGPSLVPQRYVMSTARLENRISIANCSGLAPTVFDSLWKPSSSIDPTTTAAGVPLGVEPPSFAPLGLQPRSARCAEPRRPARQQCRAAVEEPERCHRDGERVDADVCDVLDRLCPIRKITHSNELVNAAHNVSTTEYEIGSSVEYSLGCFRAAFRRLARGCWCSAVPLSINPLAYSSSSEHRRCTVPVHLWLRQSVASAPSSTQQIHAFGSLCFDRNQIAVVIAFLKLDRLH